VTSGGRLVVDALLANGADRIFCVPGESYLPVLDALHDVADRLALVVCRHESGATFMAEADGKLTGRPGIAFVTRGPGATNGSIGVHTARQDGTPLIVFVGQIDRGIRDRGAFQEVDLVAMFAPLAKWSTQIETPERIPEDVLSATVDAAPDAAVAAGRPRLHDADAAAIHAELARAARPLVIAGGGAWSAAASSALAAFAGRSELPVAVEFRCQDFLDNDHPSYAGVLGLGASPAVTALVDDADVILAVGARLGDVVTQSYTLLEIPQPRSRLLHVLADATDLHRVYQPSLAIVADPRDALEGLFRTPPLPGAVWAARTRDAHATLLASRDAPPPAHGVDLADFVRFLRERLPVDSIVVNGAGNFSIWVHRFFTYRRYGTQLAPRSGAMGYGVPAAIAAKLRHPDRIVVCFAGDGDFLMTGQELATAAMTGAAIVVIVVNNGMYGTIRMHQERAYPERVVGTHLVNPDFAAYARAFGAWGETVETSAGATAAFERALRSGGPALLELRVDRTVLTPSATIDDLRTNRH
jgi:acetolactate synthase-1/2/3 large subunit